MFSILATEFFAVGETGFYISILVLAVLIAGLYIWGNRHRTKEGKAEQLQHTYRRLSREMLDNIPDEELVDAVAANLLAKLDKQKPDAYKTIPVLSRGRCAVYSVWLTLHELNAEGLPAYIKSPSGKFLDLTIDGMELIGAINCAQALRKAKEINPFDEESLLLQQEKIVEISKQEQPLNLCCDYIRNNPDDFVDPAPSNIHTTGFDTFAE